MEPGTPGPEEINRLFNLSGKGAVVTGGALGIGREIARLFLFAGAKVVIASRDIRQLEATAKELGACAQAPDRIIPLAVDITDESSVIGLFESAQSALGSLDILVNNAGNTAKYPLLETTPEQWDALQNVNLRGPFLCLREAVKRMRAAGKGGNVVNISSLSGASTTVFGNAPYGSAKAGLNMLTKNAATEFAPDNIRVNAVLPGGVKTEGAQKLAGTFTPAGPMTGTGRLPLGRMATPTEIAATVLFLASEAGGYITGQLIVVDGGYQVS